MIDRTKAASLLSPRGLLIALCLATFLAWPMLATEGYLIYPDTKQYIRGGDIIWRMATDLVFGSTGGSGEGGSVAADEGLRNERGEAYNIRSLVYSLYTLFAGAAIWPAAFAIVQSAATIWMVFALIPPAALERPAILVAGFLVLAASSTLPWFTAYLMPDILAAAVVIYAAILIQRFDDLTLWQRIATGCIAAFAVAAHYGHLPLALALLAAVLIWRAVTRRLSFPVVAAALLPVLFSPVVNIGASTAALDTPSVAPLRLPILLARSLTDGPARWYLETACPDAPFAFCEAFGDEIPQDIDTFLWDEGGIRSVSPALMAGIRKEEYLVLWRAFQAYPLAQTRSLLGNAALQIFMIGTEQIYIADRAADGELIVRRDSPGSDVIDRFDAIVPVATWGGAAILVLLLAGRRLSRAQTEVLGVTILGLLLNAAIFGGLSAPVDRYQSRVAWLLPALAVLFLAEGRRLRGRRSTHDDPSPS